MKEPRAPGIGEREVPLIAQTPGEALVFGNT
jgi:hypothetical protein